MKFQLYVLCLSFGGLMVHHFAMSQANTALSNLTSPTSINQDLIPAVTNARGLGNASRSWKNVYVGTAVYLKNILTIHATGTNNFFAGPLAGNTTLSGSNNAALGNNSLSKLTNGSYNTAVGFSVLQNNTSGFRNAAIGYNALNKNTTGRYNTAIGDRAMYINTSGSINTALGSAALYSNTTGLANVAIGVSALYKNTTGYYSVAIGDSALYNSINSNENVGVGSKALFSTTGSYNVGVGSAALYSSTGSYNTANGYQVLYYSQGSYNAGGGSYALNNNSNGSFNNAAGFAALYLNTTGSYNSGLGAYSLYSNSTGNGNTGLGYFSDVYYGNLTNATAIGYNAGASASNQVMLGNSSVTSVKAASSVVIYSDGRFKKDVESNVPGLEFIKQLHPVTYHYDIQGMNAHAGIKPIREKVRSLKTGNGNIDVSAMEQAEKEAITQKEKKLYTGFIAQDVEATAKKLNYDFNGIYTPQNDKDLYGLSYESFVVPLVKAIQELAQQNDSLKLQNDSMQIKYDEVVKKIDKLEALITGNRNNNTLTWAGSLAQNTPNPVKGSTVIGYSLPPTFTNANIVVYDISGKKLKQINVSGQGANTIRVNTSALPPGTYSYTLFVNGAVADTKKMVLVK